MCQPCNENNGHIIFNVLQTFVFNFEEHPPKVLKKSKTFFLNYVIQALEECFAKLDTFRIPPHKCFFEILTKNTSGNFEEHYAFLRTIWLMP